MRNPADAAMAPPVQSAHRHDVIVVGGGPAGSATAIRLARLGLDVALVERASFPRSHVGICIADQTLQLLDLLEVGEAFRNAGFWRRNLTGVRWGGSKVRLVEQVGYHVDRGRLDALLLEQARSAGVHVHQPARLIDVSLGNGDGWRATLTHAGGATSLSCRFLVDATGRRSALAGGRERDGLSLLALHATWKLRQPVSFDGLIEAGEHAWAWYAQTGAEHAMVSVFVDPAHARSGDRARLEGTYRLLIKEMSTLTASLAGAEPGPIQACDATSSHASTLVDDRSIRVGDAAMSVDPLSSQGVHLALQSAIQAAVTVNTILRRPAAAEAAKAFYRERIAERLARFRARTEEEYLRGGGRLGSSFWRSRSGDGSPHSVTSAELREDAMPHGPSTALAVDPMATIARGPVVAGDFIEERPVVQHPSLDRPVAFVGEVELVPLLAALPPTFELGALPRLWSGRADRTASQRLAGWLWQHGVFVEAVRPMHAGEHHLQDL